MTVATDPGPARRRQLVWNTSIVTGLTLFSQFVALAAQVLFASLFGASIASDAYFAALAPPLYLYLVLLTSLGVVFVPIVVEAKTVQGGEAADAVASGVINLTALILGVAAGAGVIFADALIGVTAPGLSPEAHALARDLSVILWPSAVALGVSALLTELWQVDGRFAWPAITPLIGAAVNLGLLAALGPRFGTPGVAIAWTSSSFLQVALLAPVVVRRWRPSLALSSGGVRSLLIGVAPLLLANVFIRASTVVERYLASLLPAGELSQLTYASRIVTTLGAFFSGGLAAVIFPQMAERVAQRDLSVLGGMTARGMRALWLIVAPMLAIIVALAQPSIRLLFEHGAFTSHDSEAVAVLLRIYLLSLLGLALAPIAGRAIFALRATRFLAVFGVIETIAYIAYTAVLARLLGAEGIALGFAIHGLVSLLAYVLYVRRSTGVHEVGNVRPFAVTGLVAAASGASAFFAAAPFESPLVAVSAGSIVGVVVYVVGIVAIRPPELAAIWRLRG